MALTSLGVWQLFRLKDKTTFLKEISQASSAKLSSLRDIDKFKYRKVQITGRILSHTPLYLYSLKSNVPGYNVVVPVLVGSRHILLNLGWYKDKVMVYRDNGVIEGVLVPVQIPKPWDLKNDIENNTWHTLPLEQVENFTKLSNFSDLMIVPISNFDIDQIPNNHLGYAITWFSLAFASVVMYVFIVLIGVARY